MLAHVDVTVAPGVAASLGASAVEAAVEAVLAAEGVARPCMASVSFVGDARMRELNAAWRGVDAVTDVLSLECERPDDPGLAPGEPCELGDVVLAPAYVAAQAARLGTDERTEATLLVVHGVLHLLGYDHLADEDAEVMEAREDEIVARLLGRPLAHVTTTRHVGGGGVR